MSDTAAPQRSKTGASTSEATEGARRIRRSRGLPGGRAVVGALLVAAAAVATFAAYLDATAEPQTAYAVAMASVEPGTRFDTIDDVTAAFGSVSMELTEPVLSRAIPAHDLEALVGATVLSPLERGDLITRTQLLDDGGAAPAQTMSFPIGRTDAVAGSLQAGERIDVLATYGSGDSAYTAFVARGLPLLRITGSDGAALGPNTTGSELTLTVAISDLVSVQQLGHAVNTADIFVTRSTAQPGDESAPGSYQPDPTVPGPAPDDATASVLPDLAPAPTPDAPLDGQPADSADEADAPEADAPEVTDDADAGEDDGDDGEGS